MSKKKILIAASIMALTMGTCVVSPVEAGFFSALKDKATQIKNSDTFQSAKNSVKQVGKQAATQVWNTTKQMATPMIEQTKVMMAQQAALIQAQVQQNMQTMVTNAGNAVTGGIGAGMGYVNQGMEQANKGIASGMSKIPSAPAYGVPGNGGIVPPQNNHSVLIDPAAGQAVDVQ